MSRSCRTQRHTGEVADEVALNVPVGHLLVRKTCDEEEFVSPVVFLLLSRKSLSAMKHDGRRQAIQHRPGIGGGLHSGVSWQLQYYSFPKVPFLFYLVYDVGGGQAAYFLSLLGVSGAGREDMTLGLGGDRFGSVVTGASSFGPT